jgi:hypothetical protein
MIGTTAFRKIKGELNSEPSMEEASLIVRG